MCGCFSVFSTFIHVVLGGLMAGCNSGRNPFPPLGRARTFRKERQFAFCGTTALLALPVKSPFRVRLLPKVFCKVNQLFLFIKTFLFDYICYYLCAFVGMLYCGPRTVRSALPRTMHLNQSAIEYVSVNAKMRCAFPRKDSQCTLQLDSRGRKKVTNFKGETV